jgi:hypothetical protein
MYIILQRGIVEQIEREQALIRAGRELAVVYDRKVRERVKGGVMI